MLRRLRGPDRWLAAALALAAAMAGSPVLPTAGSASAQDPVPAAIGLGRTSESSRETIRNIGWRSSNWAGYVVQDGPYRSVSARWTVPKVSSSADGYSAIWIGIDGVNDRHLIQTGTEQDVRFGRARYSAWWEILPAPAVRIASLTVRPGDHMTASINRVAAGRWRITIADASSGQFTTVRSYPGRAAAAEWVEETPLVDGHVVALARHGPVTIDHATVNGASPGFAAADGGALVRRHVQILTPSPPDADGDGFRLRQSASAPAAPPS